MYGLPWYAVDVVEAFGSSESTAVLRDGSVHASRINLEKGSNHERGHYPY